MFIRIQTCLKTVDETVPFSYIPLNRVSRFAIQPDFKVLQSNPNLPVLKTAVIPVLIHFQAIRDGVIEATIDHEKGFVQSKENTDVYSTREPMSAFHQRITFCLDIHNQSVKVSGICMLYCEQKSCYINSWEHGRSGVINIIAPTGKYFSSTLLSRGQHCFILREHVIKQIHWSL